MSILERLCGNSRAHVAMLGATALISPLGSGMVVRVRRLPARFDIHLLTANHVVPEDAVDVRFLQRDLAGQPLNVLAVNGSTVVARDHIRDLAIVQVSVALTAWWTEIQPVRFAQGRPLPGDDLFIVGTPGRTYTICRATMCEIAGQLGACTGSVSRGSSGAAVTDRSVRVVGVMKGERTQGGSFTLVHRTLIHGWLNTIGA